MKSNKTMKFFSLLAVALVTVCASTLFASCGSDDDDKNSNTIVVNGQAVSIVGASLNEGGGSLIGLLTAGSPSATGINMTTVGFTIPTNQFGKTIDLSKKSNIDWSVNGAVDADSRSPLAEGSSLYVNKSGDVYTVKFTFIKKDPTGKTTTINGSYEGKNLSVKKP